MRDPFPFAAPPLLVDLTKRYISGPLQLDTLPLHIHQVILSALGYHICCTIISPLISSRLFPKTYPQLNRRTRLNWDVHIVSLFQSVLIVVLSLYVLVKDTARYALASDSIHYKGQIVDEITGLPDYRQRIWGYTGAAGLVQSLGAGYFLWDLYISLRYISVFGIGLLAHAVSALWVYSAGYRPFTNHYAPIFLLYELSSPFLNVHWFCDKLGLTGSNLQLANGIVLILTFAGSRLVWGIYHSFAVFSDIIRCLSFQNTASGKLWLAGSGRHPIPIWMAATYLASNLTLTGLNIQWMGRMISTIRARFEPPFGTRRPAAKQTETVVGRSVDQDGRRSVEVHSSETNRPAAKGSVVATQMTQEAAHAAATATSSTPTVASNRNTRSRRRA